MDYAVAFGEKSVGKAQVEKQGLYYHVVCRCRLSGEVMCRLEVSCGERRVNLGILVPEKDGFGLETRFPAAKLGEGHLEFRVLPRHEPAAERKFVPIRAEEPFAYISRLKDAFLEIQNGQVGVSIPADHSTNSTGQWSEPKISE